jgi:hypothetical protein
VEFTPCQMEWYTAIIWSSGIGWWHFLHCRCNSEDSVDRALYVKMECTISVYDFAITVSIVHKKGICLSSVFTYYNLFTVSFPLPLFINRRDFKYDYFNQ